MNKVLYFPYISIPPSTWLMQTLLYWDKIGTIVPSDYIYYPNKLGEHMRSLVKAELVDQIIPGLYVNDMQKMHDSFLDHVDKKLSKKKLLLNFYSRAGKAFLAEHESFNYSVKIHMEKLDSLADALICRGLAKRAEGPWYWVQKEIGYDFMAFLASAIGQTSRYSPITNDEIYLSNYFDSPGHKYNKLKHEAIRYRLLKDVLPVPVGDFDVDSISEFKKNNQKQLANFRNLIERFVSEANNYHEEELEGKINEFMLDIEEQKNEIKSKMAENKWYVVFSNFVAIGSAVGGVGMGLATGNKIGITMGAPRLLSAIYNVISHNSLDEFRDHPIAYSLYVEQQGKNKMFRRK